MSFMAYPPLLFPEVTRKEKYILNIYKIHIKMIYSDLEKKELYASLVAKGDTELLKWKLMNDFNAITPEDLIVPKDLALFEANISALPDGLKIGGSLRMWHCKGIKQLPN